jgi:hypothetical protein
MCRAEGSQPVSPEDFVPGVKKEALQQFDLTKLSAEQQKNYLMRVFGAKEFRIKGK